MAALAERSRRVLGIEPGEERVLVVGASALFLVAWASISVTNVAETYFLKRVGVERLPMVFLLNSVLLAGTTVAVGRMAVRSDHVRLLRGVLGFLGAMLIPLWLMVLAHAPGAFALLVIVAKQIDALAVLAFWTTFGGLVSGRQAKRLFGLVTAGGTLGTICGSFASAPLGRTFGMAALLPIATILLSLAALATGPLSQRQAPRGRRAPAPRKEEPAARRFRALWNGWLFRLLFVSSLLAGVLGPMLYFEFSYVADLATRGEAGEQRLLALYGIIRGWMNIGVLAFQIAGTSALFHWMGVPLAAAVSPVIYLLGMAGLSLRTSLPVGVAAMAGAALQDHAVYDPAERILLTLFPERVRAAVTALVGGVAKRVGSVVGNLIVLGVLALGSAAGVGWIGLPVASMWLVLAVMLWWYYPTLLLEMAGAGRAAGTPTPLAVLLDPTALRAFGHELLSPDLTRCRAACAFVVEATPGRAVATLSRALAVAPPSNRRILVAALDRILEATPVSSVSAAQEVAALLAAPDGLETIDRANLVQAYARLLGPAAAGTEWRRVLDDATRDEQEAVRVAATAALRRLEREGDLEAILNAALDSDDPATRQIVREEIRAELLRPGMDPESPAASRNLERLAAQLAHDEERPHAAAAFADVVERYGARMASQASALLAHREDHDERVRVAVLRLVGAAGLVDETGWVTHRLAATDVAEADAAQSALRTLGAAVIGALCETLRSGRMAARTRALAVLRTLPHQEELLEERAEREIEASARLLVQTEALRVGGVSDVVLRRLRERIDASAHVALLLFAAVLDDERIGHVSDRLRSVGDGRDRAILLEALEAALPPEEFERLLPLLDRERPPGTATRPGRPALSFDEAVAAIVEDGDPLTVGLLRGTLDAETRVRLRLDADGPAVPYEGRSSTMPPDVETLLRLRSLDLFERLTTAQLADLAGAVKEVTYPAGAKIVAEGDFGNELFVIKAGEVHVTRAGVLLRTARAGDYFGEMALLDGETRSATGTAVGTVRLLWLSRDAILRVMEEQPAVAIAISQTLSRRVRDLLAGRTREPT